MRKLLPLLICIMALLVTRASAVTYTVVGPASLSNGGTYVYTVTPSTSSTSTVTPAISGTTGVFSPTTLTWTSSATAQTFTFTPSNTTSGTMSFTNSGGWTDPGNISTTVGTATLFSAASGTFYTAGPISTGTGSGHTFFVPPGGGGCKVVFTGTQAEVEVFSTVTYSVDGGAFQTISLPAAWSHVVLASGLSDTTHTLSFTAVDIDYQSVDINHCTLSVLGSSPAISTIPHFATMLPFSNANWGDKVAELGIWKSATVSSVVCRYDKYNDGIIQWTGTGTGVIVRCVGSSNLVNVALLQDGIQVGALQLTTVQDLPFNNQNSWGDYVFATGLSGTHTYQLYLYTNQKVGWNVYSIGMLGAGGAGINGSGVMSVVQSRPANAMLCIGDSITEGDAATPGPHDSRLGWAAITANKLGLELMNAGISGDNASQIAGRLSEYSSLPRVVLVTTLIGQNDVATTQASYTSSIQTTLTGLRTAYPTAAIYVMGVLNPAFNTFSWRTALNTYQPVAILQSGVSSPVQFVPNSNWNDVTLSADSIHPDTPGNAALAVHVETMIANPKRRGSGIRSRSSH